MDIIINVVTYVCKTCCHLGIYKSKNLFLYTAFLLLLLLDYPEKYTHESLTFVRQWMLVQASDDDEHLSLYMEICLTCTPEDDARGFSIRSRPVVFCPLSSSSKKIIFTWWNRRRRRSTMSKLTFSYISRDSSSSSKSKARHFISRLTFCE